MELFPVPLASEGPLSGNHGCDGIHAEAAPVDLDKTSNLRTVCANRIIETTCKMFAQTDWRVMATTVPAVRGKMGSIEYYNTKMRVSDLTGIARAASKGDDWANLSIEERLQRRLNENRVRNELVPYLAKAEDRFFGSIIILVYKPETFAYEEIGQWLREDTPVAYNKVIQQLGVLTIDGGDLIVLDGQHRYYALRMLVHRKDDKGQKIDGPFVGAVRDDEISVIFVPFYGTETTRRLFNKINRSAKPSGRSDNIVTSEDDGYAILTRKMLASGEVLGVSNDKGELIVNWKSNTLGDRSAQFTTVSAVYESVKAICRANNHYFEEKDRVVRPTERELDDAYEKVSHWWTLMVENIVLFKRAVTEPDSIPVLRQQNADNLILKPAAQIAMVRGLLVAVRHGVKDAQAVKRINRIDWDLNADHWRDVLVGPSGRVVARAENYALAAELIGYLIAGNAPGYADEDAIYLRKRIAEFRGDPDYALPDPVA
ncbi:DNA sulfur modification protein DndB [Nocardia sp. CA-151230]|uniref:DNA sulfur modification protein DndB n=1 Tax=Nocardia sp. CA-151230 TaxID=3239982 RepID=UPI003D89FA1E